MHYAPSVALRILQNRGGLALSTGLGQGGSLGIGSAGLPRKCQTMLRFSYQVAMSHSRVHWSEYPYQIGKWLVLCYENHGVFPTMTQLCVVDDFGNLVGVSV